MANNIKAIRRAKDVTLKKIAVELNCSTTWIRMIERGAVTIPEGTLDNIAKILGVPVTLLTKENLKSIPI